MIKIFTVLCITILIIASSCTDSKKDDIIPDPNGTEVNVVKELIVYKWNDVLAINNEYSSNGGYNFVSYQWYIEGVMLDETKGGKSPYISLIASDLPYNKEYHCIMKTDDGRVVKTDTFIPKK